MLCQQSNTASRATYTECHDSTRVEPVSLTPEDVDTRRHAARRAEIVDRLLPVVEQKIAEDGGYLTLKLDAILQDALLSRSTFYRYFKDKNELLLALIEPVLTDVRTAAIRPFDRVGAPTLPELQAELRHHFDIYRPHIPLLNALVEVSYSDPEIRAQFIGGFTDVQHTIAAHIADGQKAGFVRGDVLPEETAGWITWMAERGMTQLVDRSDPAQMDRLAESLATMVWHTIYGPR
jgi:TetR/AcrR family transcriptional regulator, ethionamide resistance regulator